MRYSRSKLFIPLFLALAYFITGRLGLMLPAFGSNITLLWLPTGIAVAALLRWGSRCWPGVTLGALAVNLAVGTAWPVSLGIAMGNTLGPLLTVWMLRRLGFHPAFDRKRDIVLLTAAAVPGMLISASCGVAILSLASLLPAGRLAAGLFWSAGDTMGVIAAAPLVFTVTGKDGRCIAGRRAEFLIWLAATGLVTWGVFVFNRGSDGGPWALAFLPLPLVAWAALRFGAAGTSLALIALSVGAAYGTATGHGPFFRTNPIEGTVVLWIYMATSAVLGWLITALRAEGLQATGLQRVFEQALADVSLGVLFAGLDRRITYANHGFTRLTGYTEAEVLGKSCALLQGPATDPEAISRLKAALHVDGFFDGEILNYRKDGTTFWNGLLISPARDESGTMTGFLGIQRDITARKQAEVALSQSEEHLRTIIELEPECVTLVSPDGKLLEMNPAGLAMIEADSFDAVRGLPLSEVIVPENRAAFGSLHQRALQGAAGRGEFAIVGLKGARRWVETHAVPYRNARREIVGVLGIVRDITQRRKAAAEQESDLSTLQLFINTVPAYISFVDAEERYRLVNTRYEDYFGLKADRLVGQRVRDVQPSAAYAEMQPHIAAALDGQTVRYQSHVTGPDGRSYWFDVQYVPRRGEDGAVSGFFVLVFDITENKRVEDSLRTSAEFTNGLISSMQDGFSVLEANGVQQDVNPAFCRMTGFCREELIGACPPYPYWPPEESERIHASLGKMLKGHFSDLELIFMRKNGERFPVIVSPSCVKNHDGTVMSYSATVKDITERKRLEQEREQYLKFFRLSTEAMCIADPFGCFKHVNPAFMRLTGFSESELVSKPFMDFILPEDREKTAEEMKLQVAVRPSMQFENRYVCKLSLIHI